MKAGNPAHALARVLVDELARAGLTEAVAAPGSRSTPLVMAFDAEPRIRVHVEIDERSAGFLALGLARASRRPAVVLSTSGTAAANFLPAVVEAHHARVPLLVLTADRPPELRHTAANQTIDQLKLYGDAVRWFAEVGVPEERVGAPAYWRSLTCRAVAETVGSPPGPVHLNLPFREPLVPEGEGYGEPLNGRTGGRPWTAVTRPPRLPEPALVAALARSVDAAERGLLVVGETTAEAEPLLAFAAVAGWPILAEALSGARAAPHAISTYHALLSHTPFAARHRPDLVLRVGRVALSTALLDYLDRDVPQLLVDSDGAWLDPTRALERIVVADPAATFAALAAAMTERKPSRWLRSWRTAEQRVRQAIDAVLDRHEAPSEPRTARDLADLVPAGGTLVVASSMPVRDLDAFMRPRAGVRVVGNRGASGIDGFLSTALGVALGSEPGSTIAVAGDLSLLHDQAGFLLADRPDLVVVVVNNQGGGIFSFLPQAGGPGFERLFVTPHGVDLASLAAAHGCGYRRVERAAELLPLVAEARRVGGVELVEVPTDRDQNVALHRRVRHEVAAALDSTHR